VRASTLFDRGVPVLLFLGFFALYFATSAAFQATGELVHNDLFFNADTRRVFNDLTRPERDIHGKSSGVHPAFVLLHRPLIGLLRWGFRKGGQQKPEALRSAARALTGLAGALSVSLAFLLLRRLGVHPGRAAVFAAVFGASTSQWVFSSIPETWIFTGLGIAAVAIVAARPGAPEWQFQLAAVYCLSILTTNLVPVGIFALLRHGWRSPRGWLRAAASAGLTLAIVVVLNLAQTTRYPMTESFYRPSSVARERGKIRLENWTQKRRRGETAEILLRHLWVANVVAPEAYATPHRGHPSWTMAQIEGSGWGRDASRAGAFAAWLVILGIAGPAAGDSRFYNGWCLSALACLAWNFGLLSIFGDDRMLYACSWTLFSVGIVAWGFDATVRRHAWLEQVSWVLLGIFVAWQIGSNGRFLGDLRALVSG
jgi:hypothetical protein